jgi:hypothetical protein
MENKTIVSAELLSNIHNMLLNIIVNSQDISCEIVNEPVNYIWDASLSPFIKYI